MTESKVDDRFRKVVYRPKASIAEIKTRDDLNEMIRNGDIEQKIVQNFEESEDAIDSFYSTSPEQLIGYKKDEFAAARIQQRSVVAGSVHYVEPVLEPAQEPTQDDAPAPEKAESKKASKET